MVVSVPAKSELTTCEYLCLNQMVESGKLCHVVQLVSLGANLAVLAYLAQAALKPRILRQDKDRQHTNFVKRLWELVTVGHKDAGIVPEDLGSPDEDGVYHHVSPGGGELSFRLVKDTEGGWAWLWSKDGCRWRRTRSTDTLEAGEEEEEKDLSPAQKVLLKRLELESVLMRTSRPTMSLTSLNTCLPPLDLSSTKRSARWLALSAPAAFLCPLTLQLMTDPVVTPSGMTFNRESIQAWVEHHHTDPATGAALHSGQLYPNLTLRDLIQKWLVTPERDDWTTKSLPEPMEEWQLTTHVGQIPC